MALSLCKLQMVEAQAPPQGNQNYGTFGNRTLGQSLVPTPSTFGGAVQTAPGGSFLLWTVRRLPSVRHAGAAEQLRGAMPNAVAQPAPNTAASPQSAVQLAMPRTAVHHEFGPPLVRETNWPEGTDRTAPALGLRAPGTPGRGTAAVSRQPAEGLLPFAGVVRSLDADRTCTKGLLFGPAIDVYVKQRHRSYSGRT